MLVLSRRKNQKVWIGDEIAVTVVRIRGDVVHLGFEAPEDVVILRGELAVESNGNEVHND